MVAPSFKMDRLSIRQVMASQALTRLLIPLSDGNDHTTTATITVSVTSANQAPDVNDDYLGLQQANSVIVIQPLTNDSDPDGDELQIISVGSTPNGTAVANGDGTISFTPVTDFCGNIQFTYTVSDGNGHVSTATVFLQTEFL